MYRVQCIHASCVYVCKKGAYFMSVMPSSTVYKWKKKTAKMSTKRKKKACKMSTKRKNGLQKCQKEKTDFKNVYKKTGEVSTKRKKD